MLGVFLGRITLVVLYAAIWLSRDGSDNDWAFGTMWVMAFVPYLASVGIGLFAGALFSARRASRNERNRAGP